MNWFKSLFNNENQRRRVRPQSPLVRTEKFERRLCLGRMVAPQAEPAQPVAQESASFNTGSVNQIPTDDGSSHASFGRSSLQPGTIQQVNGTTTASVDPAPLPIQTPVGPQIAQAIDSDLGSALTDTPIDSAGASEPSSAPLQFNSAQISTSPGGAMPGTLAPSTGGGRGGSAPSTTPPVRTAASAEMQLAAKGESAVGGPQDSSGSKLSAQDLAKLGLQFDADGNAIGLGNKIGTHDLWWKDASGPTTVRYDFRNQNGFQNQITDEQKALAVQALQDWSTATGGQIVFVQDTTAPESQIINIGIGDLQAVGYTGGASVISLGGGQVTLMPDGSFNDAGIAWLDASQKWSMSNTGLNLSGTYDFYTIVAHEVGHALGFGESMPTVTPDIMTDPYQGPLNAAAIAHAVQHDLMYIQPVTGEPTTDFALLPMNDPGGTLISTDVQQLLARAAGASTTENAIIAIVDRNGEILGVRVEAGVLAQISDPATLVFAIDGAVAEARTAAMFSNGSAPLTSRTIQYISQSTITQREVQSTPDILIGDSAAQMASTVYGPGFVAPIGLGGHFPPGIEFTPPVDLFDIEHTNRDRTTVAGGRFGIDPAYATTTLMAPESYGTAQNSGLLPEAQSRGFGTLPGGIPIYQNGILVGGIGVFFPGPKGFADFEQGFKQGTGQTEQELVNSRLALEAEFMAYAAVGGTSQAAPYGITAAQFGTISGVAPVAGVGLPFGFINLGGIALPIYGPGGPIGGLQTVLDTGKTLGTTQHVNANGVVEITGGKPNSGADQPLNGAPDGFHRTGQPVANGWLVQPHDAAPGLGGLTASDVKQIIEQGVDAANYCRAAIRLPFGSTAKMCFAVCDTAGNLLGLYRMPDATTFSIGVAVAKARNVSYYNNPSTVFNTPKDQVTQNGVAFTNRTYRFLAEPRYPSGIDGTEPPQFSTLNDPGINPETAENLGAPLAASNYMDNMSSVAGHDAFVPESNFHATQGPNQNGVVFFPGSTSIYRNGKMIGGLGVSGDGVDQDDTVTFVATINYMPNSHVTRADQVFFGPPGFDEAGYQNQIRLPYIEFLRNAFVL
ncbi:MAG: heme-binding protein [Planctomycetes bacterium]|nr:heme-binding protein [Planctomycetota bacterium]